MATPRASTYSAPSGGSVYAGTASPFGVIGAAAALLSPAAWQNISDLTNVATVTDATAPNGTTAWLEGDNDGAHPLLNWPGNITWDAPRKRVIAVGASNGFSSDTPAGKRTKTIFFDVLTGVFYSQWKPFDDNSGHQYDANSSAPCSDGYIRRRSFNPGGAYKMDLTTNVWSAAEDLTGMGIASGASPSAEFFPTLGAQGSWMVVGTGGGGAQGRVGRLDIASGDVTQPVPSSPGVGGPEVLARYHPGADLLVYGGGAGSSSLYKMTSAGAASLLINSLPPGVSALGPQTSGSSVLAPDPLGRTHAWLFDFGATRKKWRIDLAAGTPSWVDGGSIDSGLGSNVCITTIPELGVHLLFDSKDGSRTSGLSNGQVWMHKPA